MANFDEKFSECVRQFPVLYDKEIKDFKDKNKKQKAWEVVASTMGMKKGRVEETTELEPLKYLPPYWPSKA